MKFLDILPQPVKIVCQDEDEDEDDGDKGNRVNVTPAQMVAAVCVSKRMNRRERDSKWQPMAELKFVQMLKIVE